MTIVNTASLLEPYEPSTEEKNAVSKHMWDELEECGDHCNFHILPEHYGCSHKVIFAEKGGFFYCTIFSTGSSSFIAIPFTDTLSEGTIKSLVHMINGG